jgi:hypothetical protein
LDVAVLAGILAVLAFPALSRVAADRQPVAPGPAVVLPPLTPAGNAPLRVLPTGLAPGPPPRRLADLRPAANALLGEARGARFLAQVSAQTFDAGGFRYPEFERIVPAGVAPAAATDLGARLIALGRGRPRHRRVRVVRARKGPRRLRAATESAPPAQRGCGAELGRDRGGGRASGGGLPWRSDRRLVGGSV